MIAPLCPTCQTPMLDAMIGVTVTVYQGPVEAMMVRGWSCPTSGCGAKRLRNAYLLVDGEQRSIVAATP